MTSNNISQVRLVNNSFTHNQIDHDSSGYKLQKRFEATCSITQETQDHKNLVIETDQNITIDELTGEILDPLFEINEEVENLNHLKVASIHNAQSLAYSHDLKQAERGSKIFKCSDHLREVDGKYRATYRCKSRACFICARIQSSKFTARSSASLAIMRNKYGYFLEDEPTGYAKKARNSNGALIAIKLTLNTGEACLLADLNSRLALLHSSYKGMYNHLGKNLEEGELIGGFRATEIIQSEVTNSKEIKAHPHIHGFILVKSTSDISAIKEMIRSYWYKTLRLRYARSKQSVNYSSAIQSEESIQELSNQTDKDLCEWIAYATKGSYDLLSSKKGRESRDSQIMTSHDFWITVEQVIKRMNMIATYGLLRIALKEAEENHKSSKTKIHSFSQKQTIKVKKCDLIFCYQTKRYIKADTRQGSMNHFAYTQSLSRIEAPPIHFCALWRIEKLLYDKSISEAKALKMLRLLTLGSYNTMSTKGYLVLNKTEQGQDNPRSWHEPKERPFNEITIGSSKSKT